MAICVRCSYWIKLSPRMWVGSGLESYVLLLTNRLLQVYKLQL
nr:MAG TPA: hypothetical protein [Caudoviricetes sp.]